MREEMLLCFGFRKNDKRCLPNLKERKHEPFGDFRLAMPGANRAQGLDDLNLLLDLKCYYPLSRL